VSRPGAPDQESHFHAKAAEREATYAFDGIPVHGSLPRNKDRLGRQWAADHQDDLEQCWNQCQRGEDIGTIELLP
jgi:hypothetical protein